MAQQAITTYETSEYLRRFIPDPTALKRLLAAVKDPFFILPVEQMYPFFTQALPPARSTAHNCLYLTSGTATMNIDTETCIIGPQELLIVRAGQVYSFAPGDQNTGFLFTFTNEVLIGRTGTADALSTFGFLQFWDTPYIRLDKQTAGYAENLLARLLSEYESRGLQSPDLLQAYLLALLHELNRAYSPDPALQRTAALTITNRFRQLVATSLQSSHRVSDYAERLHITPNHLTKSVRTVTGKAPAKWIEEMLVLEAKVLLGQTDLSVSEVAEKVGINDSSYFSRLFRKQVGMSPLTYRKMIGKS